MFAIEPDKKCWRNREAVQLLHKPFKNQINEIYNDNDEDKLTLHYSLKVVVEKNLKKVVFLSKEIREGIEDEKEFATHLQSFKKHLRLTLVFI